MIKNKDGSTLIMIVVLVAILGMLGVAVQSISLADKKQYVQQDKNVQTYYLARAGADAVAEHIISNFDTSFFSVGSTFSEADPITLAGSAGSFVTSVRRQTSTSDIEIVSVGTLDNQSTEVRLKLTNIVMDKAIFANEPYDLDGIDVINGDIGSNGDITGEPKVLNGEVETYMDVHLTSANFSLISSYDDGGDYSLSVSGTFDGQIDDNTNGTLDGVADGIPDALDTLNYNSNVKGQVGYDRYSSYESTTSDMDFYGYDTFEFDSPSGNITFDTKGSVLRIVTDELTIKGDVYVSDVNDVKDTDPSTNGKVIFYVRDSAFINNPGDATNNPDEFIVYLAPGAVLEIKNPREFSGRIIGPDASVSCSSNGTIKGSVIANSFSGTSNTNLEYIPPEDGEMTLGFVRALWE